MSRVLKPFMFYLFNLYAHFFEQSRNIFVKSFCAILVSFLLFSVTAAWGIQPGSKETVISRKLVSQDTIVDGFRIVRGERPPINLDRISANAWKQGVVRIKLQGNQENEMILAVMKADDGYVRTGITQLDQLNQKYGVVAYTPLLEAIYQKSTFTAEYEALLKAWGFHLWYDLEFTAKSDIRSVIADFENLQEVAIAEPVFAIRLIEPVEMTPADISWQEELKEDAVFPDDWYFRFQWHYHNTGQSAGEQVGIEGVDIALKAAWKIETGKPGVIVAITDMGMDFRHEDLALNMWEHIGPDGENTFAAPISHGSHVGGTVAAVTNNGTGVAGIAGGSGSGDGVRLMSVDIFNNENTFSQLACFIYPAFHGAAISQNSWTYTEPDVYSQVLLDGIDFFNLYGGGEAMPDGGITIFAAGNSNDDGKWFPGYYSGVMAVAAYDNKGRRAEFSNFGDWIDISAPGVNVMSTINEEDNKYGSGSGTSMAAPHVTGVAALVLSHVYGILTPDQLWNILVNNTSDIYQYNGDSLAGMLGSGSVNAYKALMAARIYLERVGNIKSLKTAQTDVHAVQLVWEKNDSLNPVMLVVSETGLFDKPLDGSGYLAGDTIGEKGVVLYVGEDNEYLHDNLAQGKTYHYRAYSFSENHNYATGKDLKVTTHCGYYKELPYSETFDNYLFAPNCWEVVDNYGEGQVWRFGATERRLENSSGFYAFVSKDAYVYGSYQDTDLISPAFDFSHYRDVSISFVHFFSRFNIAVTSAAGVYWSDNDGQNWNLIHEWRGPVGNGTRFQRILPQLEGLSNVRFKFNAAGHHISEWAVDNFEIHGTSNTYLHNFTLEVDMAPIDHFVHGQHKVFVSGNFTRWTEPGQGGAFEMSSHPDNPFVHTLVLDSIPAGVLQYRYYTDAIGQGWEGGENVLDADRVKETPEDGLIQDVWESFSPEFYSVTLVSAPAFAGTQSGEGEFAAGNTIMIKTEAAANPGFAFWTDGYGNFVSDQPDYAFRMPARDVAMSAVYRNNTSIDDYNLSLLVVYPNPCSDVLYVKNIRGMHNIKIFNSTGQLMLVKPVTGQERASLSLENFEPGFYILVAESAEGKNAVHKVLKK